MFDNAKFLQDDYGDKLPEDGVNRPRRLGYLRQRMEQLVNDLLHFARLGRQELAGQPTDLNAVIRDIEMMSETTLSGRNATIVIPRPLPQISCDKTRITEVFRNLISNAAKYNDNDVKRIEIGYLPNDGPGIAPEHQRQIFEPFRRLNRDNVHCGLGLAICQKIIEAHGGKLDCESAIGLGSSFFFTPPRAAAVNSQSAREESIIGTSEPRVSVRVANVLLVDDRDGDILFTRALITGRLGMRCNLLVAHDGKAGSRTDPRSFPQE